MIPGEEIEEASCEISDAIHNYVTIFEGAHWLGAGAVAAKLVDDWEASPWRYVPLVFMVFLCAIYLAKTLKATFKLARALWRKWGFHFR